MNTNNQNHFPTKEESLAKELASGLEDMESLNFYLSVAHKYNEKLLRKIYGQVLSFPKEKIRKTRGALFNHILQTKSLQLKTQHPDSN